jgi:F-type H+-transporting ATPase subunit delta
VSSPTARRYAKAIFMIGVEEGRLDALTREINDLAATLKGSPELLGLLANPVVREDSRRAVMKDIAERMGLSPTARNVALLLADRRKGALIPDVALALSALGDEKAGKVQAEVTSAVPLSDAQYARLTGVLEKLTGRTITLSRKVDAALIGGVVTRIGDKVYDGSVRTRLEELRTTALQA